MEEIEIPESYVKMEHPILKEICPICNNIFVVGDKVILVTLQESKDDRPINSIGIPVHTNCHYI